MKNTGIKIFISLLIIGMVSFYYATMDFDARLIADQLYGYSNSSKDIEYSCNLKDDDIYSEDYYNAIVDAAVNNGLDIGQIDIDPYLGINAEYYRYYLPNDYYDSILLANNEYVDISSKKSYATDSKDPELRIFTMSGINPQVLEPLSYESFDPSRSFYLLPVSDNADIESFKDELFALYPDSLNIETFETTISSDGYIDFNDFLFTNQYYIYIAFLALFFGIVANSSILKDTDNISKEKLEGYGSLELLWRYSLKHIVISHILLIAGYIVAFKMLYPISIFKVEYFWLQLIKYNLVSLSILSLIALIYFAEIWFTPINLNIKGKNHIKEIISLLFSLKLFILVVSSLTFIAYFTNAVMVLNYASLKNSKLDNSRHSSVTFSKNSKFKAQNVSSEINVIGQTVDEAVFVIDKYLDDCSIAKLSPVRIVHGKGTGKLREGIHKFLKTNPHVKSFRLGTFGEGEMGVTIVELK